MFKIKGTIKMIGETNVINDKFRKRDFVLTSEDDMYPQQISFQVVQDKCDDLNNFKEGMSVEVSFNLRGREWTSPTGDVKYFNTLEAWRIETAQATATVVTPEEKVEEDLPF
jgi:hypothetical protein